MFLKELFKPCCRCLNEAKSIDDNVNVFRRDLLFLGPAKAGKSLLLYSSCHPEWKDIATECEPKAQLEYHDLYLNQVHLGLWQISGELEELWISAFSTIQMHAVIYVVDSKNMNDDISYMTRQWLQIFGQHKALLYSYIIVVINTYGQEFNEDDDFNRFLATSGINNVKEMFNNPKTFRFVMVNTAVGLNDENWRTTLTQILRS